MFTYVTVRGSWSNSSDVVAEGSVTFLPTAAMENHEIIPASPVVACLEDGGIEVTLAANNDPGTVPENVAYHVIETVNGVIRQYVIQLSHETLDYDLSSIEKGQVAPAVTWPAVWS